jgi:LCP family protein required for cell wall assembly
MSDDWPQGWYRGEGAEQASGAAARGTPSWTPSPQNAWPAQPPVAAPPTAPAGRPPSGPSRPGGRRWRFWGQPGHRAKRIGIYFVTLVVVLVVAVVSSYFWINGKLNRSVALPATTNVSAGTNWLIAGADTRNGLSTQQIIADHVGFDYGTANSDSLMLLHIGSNGRPVLVSIPRDSYVPIPGHGENKINAALGFGGPALLIQTVEDVTGLKINHYMGIGFGGLVDVVNQVGGVTICLPAPLQDSDSGVNLKAGCQSLSGTQALAFVRDRHSFATEDLQREEDQRAFLKALMSKAMSPSVYLNPFVGLPFASTSASSITVDDSTSVYDLYQAAMALRNPETTTVPIANANYYTSNAGDAVEWNQSQALELFNDLAQDKTVPSSLISGTTVG